MQNLDKHALLDSIEKIYEWTDLTANSVSGLDATRLLAGSTKAVLLQLALVGKGDFVIADVGRGNPLAKELLALRDQSGNFLAHCRGWDQGNVYDASRLQLAEDFSSSVFFKEMLEPNNIHYSIAGVVLRERASCIVLCCYRTLEEGPFTDHDLKNLGQLLPHWRRAIDLKNRLNQMNIQSQATHRILDHAPFSIVLVDSTAFVLYGNYMSSVAGGGDDGLGVRDSRLRFKNPEMRKQFLQLLSSADELRDKSDTASPFMMSVERTSGSKPFQLMVLPVQSAVEAGLSTGPTYAVFIYDPMVNLPVDTGALCTLEGLTQAEAKLCESLYMTKSLGEAAKQLDVSISTAKTHLLNTFRKLDINSQSELMKYLAHMPKISAEPKH